MKILTYEESEKLFNNNLEHDVLKHLFEDFSEEKLRLVLMEIYNTYKEHIELNCKREISSFRHLGIQPKIETAVQCLNDYTEFMITSKNGIPKDCKTINHDYIVLDFEFKLVSCAYKQLFKKADVNYDEL